MALQNLAAGLDWTDGTRLRGGKGGRKKRSVIENLPHLKTKFGSKFYRDNQKKKEDGCMDWQTNPFGDRFAPKNRIIKNYNIFLSLCWSLSCPLFQIQPSSKYKKYHVLKPNQLQFITV